MCFPLLSDSFFSKVCLEVQTSWNSKPCFQNEWKEDTDLHRDSKPDGKLKSLLKQFYSFDRFNRKLWTLPRLGSRVDAHQLFCWSGMLSLTLPRPFSSLLLLLLSSSVPAQLPEPVSMVTPGELCWGENKRAEKPRGPCVQTESGGSGRVGGRRKKAREVSREVAFCDLWRKWGRPLSSPAPPYCFILAWSSCSQTLSETNCMKTRKSRCVWRVGDPKTTTAPPSPSAVLLHPLLMLHNQRTAHAQENRRPPSTQRCQRRNTRTRGHKKLLVGFCCFHLSADQLVEQQSGKTLTCWRHPSSGHLGLVGSLSDGWHWGCGLSKLGLSLESKHTHQLAEGGL